MDGGQTAIREFLSVGEFSPLKEFTVTFCHFFDRAITSSKSGTYNYEKEIDID